MSEPEANRERMLEFLGRVDSQCVPATLDCVPENASAATSHGQVHAQVSRSSAGHARRAVTPGSQGLRSVDSKAWTPELPERIGIYHSYIRGYNRDVRAHKLFVCCSGGLNRASDAFCNLVSALC